MKFSINDFYSKCDQVCRKVQIWSHLLKKSLMKIFIFLCSGLGMSTKIILEGLKEVWNTKIWTLSSTGLQSVLPLLKHIEPALAK